MYQPQQEKKGDGPVIEALLDKAFGPDRHRRTAYLFRKLSPPVPGLSFVLKEGDLLLGSIRFWPARLIDEAQEATPTRPVRPALLLGPLAVLPERRGEGIGHCLLYCGTNAACKQFPQTPIFLIGDEDYYKRADFRKISPSICTLPGPVDQDRILHYRSGREDIRDLPARFSLMPNIA